MENGEIRSEKGSYKRSDLTIFEGDTTQKLSNLTDNNDGKSQKGVDVDRKTNLPCFPIVFPKRKISNLNFF